MDERQARAHLSPVGWPSDRDEIHEPLASSGIYREAIRHSLPLLPERLYIRLERYPAVVLDV